MHSEVSSHNSTPTLSPQAGGVTLSDIYVGDEEAEPVSTVYHVYNFARAQALAQRMAQDRRLELIHEAATA
jgi:hypothetical protein